MKQGIRILSLLMTAALLLSCGVIPGLATDAEGREVIRISTTMEFVEFAAMCHMDSWSQTKQVILEADIDLSGVAYEPIATFGGEFLGQNHTIRGLTIANESSSVGGLFRYVQPGALIRDLNVSGSIHPVANRDSFGGIAGENSGNLINCSFAGTVDGGTGVGGIAGVNTAAGQIYGCSVNGFITGEHSTGGVVGENLGSVIRCTNAAAVNTTDAELSVDEISLDVEHLNNTENVAAHTDSGGIAGYSSGIIQSCTNNGPVGYPHVGYNVGGIAGRQSGYLDGCENNGEIYGRKDVGGIVGQLVPNIQMEYSDDVLGQLETELDILQQQLDTVLSDLEGASNTISARLTNAGVYLGSARESVGSMTKELTAFVNGNVDSVNSFSATIVRYVERLGPILQQMKNFASYMNAAAAELGKAMDELEEGSDEAGVVMENLNLAMEKLSQAMDSAETALGHLEGLMNDLNEQVELGGPIDWLSLLVEYGDDIEKAMDELETAMAAGGEAADYLELAFDAAEDLLAEVDDALPYMESAMDYMESAMSSLTLALEGFSKWVEDLGKEEPMQLVGISGSFNQSAERLDASLAGLTTEFEGLNQAVNSAVGQLTGDLQAVNNQFFRVMDLFIEFVESSGETDAANLMEDISEESMFTATEGKVAASVNRGSVNGDVNVGGVAGIMAVEYDLDPEEDVSVSGSQSMRFRYLARAVILDCENSGDVTAKKDCAGGVAGKTDLGIVYGCSGLGNVASSSGDYVGGVVGQSAATLRSSHAMCRLSGLDYVGGIAGEGTDIYDCCSLVKVDSARGWSGAIAGAAIGELEGNIFVSDTLSGVDGISYAGKAEPVSYGRLIQEESLPEAFSSFSLSFVADGEKVLEIPFTYGMSISADSLPAVPLKEGHTGTWNKQSWERLTFSETVEAVYVPYSTVIASEQLRGEQNLVLAEGAFLPEAALTLVQTESSKTAFTALEKVREAMSVTVSGHVGESLFLRYLVPEDVKSPEIWVLNEGEWRPVETTEEGSYRIFPVEGETVVFCCLDAGAELPYALIIALAAAVLALAIGLCLRGKKKTASRGKHEKAGK